MEHGTLVGHVVIVVVQALGFWFQWASEGRRHQWQVEQTERMEALKVQIKNGHGDG